MAYDDLANVQATDPGDILTAAWCDQARDNDEFFIDPPACSVQGTAAVSAATGTIVTLTAGQENFDNDSMHSTVSNPERITVQTAGRYDCQLVIRIAYSATAASGRLAQFFVNGTTQYNIAQISNVTHNGARDTILSGSRKIVLDEGDFIVVRARQDTGNTVDITLDEFALTFITRA